MARVSVWTRERVTRKYVRVDPKRQYPLATIFGSALGKLLENASLAPGTDAKLAFAIAKGKEAELFRL